MMAIEYRGDEILFVVAIPNETSGETLARPFNQTAGSTSISADSIDLDTKDKSGSDYGKVTREISIEGVISEGDPFVDYIEEAMTSKEFVKIYEVNTRTKKAKHGLFQVSSFERSFGTGDFATYSLSGTLNGKLSEETLTEIPEGAQ
jgi:TP901-1 family phage major tail protein